MTKNRTNLEIAAGKLISAIQKEWGKEAGESVADVSESVMNKGHDLLQAANAGEIQKLLGGRSISEFLGELWLKKHPSVKPAVSKLEAELKFSENV
jgi:hypothetical protein